MAEESPQNINPATDPQVEDPPSTAVPVTEVDRAPGEVSPSVDPQVPVPQTETVPATDIETSPGAVAPGTNPQVPAPADSLSEAFVYPEPQPPAFEPFQVAQAGTIPVTDAGFTPVSPDPGTVEARIFTGEGSVQPGSSVVTAPRIVTDPSTVGIPVRDETGAVSNIRINPETGQPYNAQGLPAAQFPETATTPPASQTQTAPASTLPGTPETPAPAAPPPPASQVQTAPAPAPAEDYGSSGDAAALEQAQRAEAEAFRQGRIPQPVTDPPDPQIPATDGTTAGPGITGPVDGISPYGEANELPEITINSPGAVDPRALGENVGGVLDDPRALGENVGQLLTDPRAVGENAGSVLDDPRAVGENVGTILTDPRAVGENAGSVLDDPRALGENVGSVLDDPRALGENVGTVTDQALRENARNQQAIRDQRRNVNTADWRVRLRLAPNANYLYNAEQPGILQPLSSGNGSDGVIFPYTPTIQTVYKANYNSYDLTHSNYRGYFYQSSVVEDIQITGVFTAQDTIEAEYLLAVIHFFRSVTKMFYGQDPNRGAPPPLVYLSALGEYQYVDAPCVVTQFNYNLPSDVDYIRVRSPNQDGTNMLKRRVREPVPTNAIDYALKRLRAARLPAGGKQQRPPPPTLGLNSPTYVPTRMEITVVLHPMQSRQQVSQEFALRDYATGRLQTKGYW